MQKITREDPSEGGFRQAMAWLHTWSGLILGWLLFFIFLTGTAGYFDTEIDRWMQPELPRAQPRADTAATAAVLLQRLRSEAPAAERWLLLLPVDRNQPYPGIAWRGAAAATGASAASGSARVDGSSGKTLAARDTGGGQALYRMHWRLHYLSRAQADVIVGVATLFMLVALITGVIIHKKIFKDFFTFRPGKGQRSWLDAHNVLGVAALPFHLMITYSGLVFMAFSYMPLILTAHYGAGGSAQQQFRAEVSDPPGLVEAAGEPAALVALGGLIAKAEDRWGQGRIRSIDIRHPQHSNARVIFHENIEKAAGNAGERLVFDGVDGTLLHTLAPATSAAQGFRGLLIGLHEGLFAPPLLRWLYFCSGLLGTGMIATGLVLWTAKRRRQAVRAAAATPAGLLLVEKLNVGTVVGLPLGIAAYFWANRLLAVDIAGRADWEIHIMFLTWLAMLIHAAVRPAQRAWGEQLLLAAFAFGALPLLNAITTERHLGHSLAAGDWVFAGFDLSVLAIGLVSGWAARRLWKRPRQAAYLPVAPAALDGTGS